MNKFEALLSVAKKLLGPDGCPWDREQTFANLQPYVLEEAHELVEAVDLGEDAKIVEELGDLLYIIIFYTQIAEKESRFSLEDVLDAIREKMIRRHPHVFGDVEVQNIEELHHVWEQVKKKEVVHVERKSAIDGIPPSLSSLMRAQKVVKKVQRAGYSLPQIPPAAQQQIGEALLELALQAEASGVDSESALRHAVQNLESDFRKWEEKKT